uniref:NAC domain-containing protein n=1 Tax=Oryza nivara TaxID=4536 RepID=A0A0E0IJH6_ORYNI
MMHEFRLPSLTEPSLSKIPIDKKPAKDIWAICKILKKPNSMAQRALSHPWGPQSTATTSSQFASESSSCSEEVAIPITQLNSQQCLQGRQQKPNNRQDGSSSKVINFKCSPSLTHQSDKDNHNCPVTLPFKTQTLQHMSGATSLLLSITPGIINSIYEASPNIRFGQTEPCNGYEVDWVIGTNGGIENSDEDPYTRTGTEYSTGSECGIRQKIKFPFDLLGDPSDNWTSNINMPCEFPLTPNSYSHVQ